MATQMVKQKVERQSGKDESHAIWAQAAARPIQKFRLPQSEWQGSHHPRYPTTGTATHSPRGGRPPLTRLELPAEVPHNCDAAPRDDRGPVTPAEVLQPDSQGHTTQQIQNLRRIQESRARAHRAESSLNRLLVLATLQGIFIAVCVCRAFLWKLLS